MRERWRFYKRDKRVWVPFAVLTAVCGLTMLVFPAVALPVYGVGCVVLALVLDITYLRQKRHEHEREFR